MLLSARRVDAATALDWGLVSEIVDGDVVQRAEEIAEEIAELPRLALARTKASLRRALAHGLDDELAVMGAQQGQLLVSEEFLEVTARLSGGRK
jgi:enoyl-CoA hydratase/carnithine racemase